MLSTLEEAKAGGSVSSRLAYATDFILKDKEDWECISTEECLHSLCKVIDSISKTEKIHYL